MIIEVKLNFTLSVFAGTSPVPVTGKKGGNVTLPCEFEARQISDLVLSRMSKKILVCGSKGCESKNSRVFKEGACDIIIMDLRLRDAGIYMLNVYRNNDQKELERKIKYQLHIQGKVKTDQTINIVLSGFPNNVSNVVACRAVTSKYSKCFNKGLSVADFKNDYIWSSLD